MLDAVAATKKIAAINEEYNLIGRANGTRMPRSTKHTDKIAWEYHVASHLARIAEARREKAHREAVKLGVLFDHRKEPLPEGTDQLIYAGDIVEIAVKVTTPADRLDPTELGVALVKAGVAMKTVEKVFRACTHQTAAPHKFVSSLVTA